MPLGMIVSPNSNIDGHYYVWLDCVWTIEMPVNKAINLTFVTFDLEGPAGTCSNDYVKVRVIRSSGNFMMYMNNTNIL